MVDWKLKITLQNPFYNFLSEHIAVSSSTRFKEFFVPQVVNPFIYPQVPYLFYFVVVNLYLL